MVPIASDNGIMRYIPHITKTAQQRNHTGYSVGRPVITSAQWFRVFYINARFASAKAMRTRLSRSGGSRDPSESRRLSMPAPLRAAAFLCQTPNT